MSNLSEALEQIQLDDLNTEEIYIVSGLVWEQYEHFDTLLNTRGYRISYLDGVVEIISPSRDHEIIKENLGRLLEIYFEEQKIPFWGLGLTTLRVKDQQVGKEPDKSYCIYSKKNFPDLAIEVVKTSGGVNTLEIYQRLKIKEVWFWQNNQLSIYSFQGDRYQLIPKSDLLQNLDVELLKEYINQIDILAAIKGFRAKIQG